MRVFLVVIDSFGIGAMPDAEKFGDGGSDTYGNIVRRTGLRLPNLERLGLNRIDGVSVSADKPEGGAVIGRYARLAEKSPAKDTTAGHFEIAGLPLEKPFPVYPDAFPQDLVKKLDKACGCEFMANEVASGTEIIARLGDEHRATKRPILYTSQDSVLQIAAHTDVVPLERLYDICEKARAVMTGEHAVGRVIARPFAGKSGEYVRTPERRDYALPPPGPTLPDKLTAASKKVAAIGKISDIFCGRGIAESVHTASNAEGLDAIDDMIAASDAHLIFANLVDTDMLYGHRNDAEGYANALRQIDARVGGWIQRLRADDYLIVTADHGCDPTTPSTDHSREYVPLLAYHRDLPPENLGTILGFDYIARSILDLYQIEYYAKSVFRR